VWGTWTWGGRSCRGSRYRPCPSFAPRCSTYVRLERERGRECESVSVTLRVRVWVRVRVKVRERVRQRE
jgi:hypothetical protein